MAILIAAVSSCRARDAFVDDAEALARSALERREQAGRMLDHAFGSYMEHAYPWDELKPLSCSGRRWDRRERGTIDDTLGGFSLTLIDSLDTLAVAGRYREFYDSVDLVRGEVSFDRDVTVSVFETTIRVLGGLLSAHLLLADGVVPGAPGAWAYDGELLDMAIDLGERLMPAFETPTGIPYHRVNLRRGVEASETSRTCTAAAGTLLVEFGLLSRLSDRPEFEDRARTAMLALWKRRDPKTGLVGNTIDARTGKWLQTRTGSGPGVDSFFEYLLKASILLEAPGTPFAPRQAPAPGESLLEAFAEALARVEEHLTFGPWHIEVDMGVGRTQPLRFGVSALQAFWPGLLASVDRLESAESSFDAFYGLWRAHGAMPEDFDLLTRRTTHYGKGYYLRPELAESAMLLYQKTGKPKFVEAAAQILDDIERRCRVSCGYTSLRDVGADSDARNREDRMDSYFIAETLKYLYIVFDMAARNSTRVSLLGEAPLFTTEGHLVFLRGRSLDQDEGLAARAQGVPASSHAGGTLHGSRPAHAVQAQVRVQALLTPHLHVPVIVPQGSDRAPSVEFIFAPASFGRLVPRDLDEHVILVKAHPPRACTPLVNSDKLAAAAKLAGDLRLLSGQPLALAVVAERGDCSFVHKVATIANATMSAPARVDVVIIVNSQEDGDALHTMSDDGSARKQGAGLPGVRSMLAPRALAVHLEQAGFPLAPGLPEAGSVHQSHYAVLRLKGAVLDSAGSSAEVSVPADPAFGGFFTTAMEGIARAFERALAVVSKDEL